MLSAAAMIKGKRQRPWEDYIKTALRKLESEAHFERPDDALDLQYDGESKIEHPFDSLRRPGWPRIISGAIGTADTLLKDPAIRDSLRDRFRVRAIEMEGSGLQTAAWAHGKDIMVIRGICDYCDKRKNDDWQNYSALAAAAYARALIEMLPDEWFE